MSLAERIAGAVALWNTRSDFSQEKPVECSCDADPEHGGSKYATLIYQYDTEKWGHLDIPLSNFAALSATRPVQGGDRIVRFQIFGGVMGGKPLYIDNLKSGPSLRPPVGK